MTEPVHEAEQFVPNEHPDDVDLDVPVPTADTGGDPLPPDDPELAGGDVDAAPAGERGDEQSGG